MENWSKYRSAIIKQKFIHVAIGWVFGVGTSYAVDFHMANTSFSIKKPLNNTTCGKLTAQSNTTYLDLTAA